MKWNRFLLYSVHRKMWSAFILLVALTVLSVSGTLYFLFASKTEETISKNVIAMLQQTSYTSNIVHEQIQTIGNHLLSNNKIITVLMNNKHDYIQDRDAMDILADIQSAYPFIKYIGIYNDNTKRYLNTGGTPYMLNEEEQKHIAGIAPLQYMDFFTQHLQPSTAPAAAPPKPVLTFILRPNYALTSAYRGAIIIDVDELYILNTIKSIGSTSDDVFVLDSKGLVLSHTDPAQFMQNYAGESYIKQILESEKKAGHFNLKLNGKKQLVSYVKSEQLNWWFISIKDYRMLVSDIASLRIYTGIIAFTMILLGIFIAYLATNKLYHPLGRLIQKVNDVMGSNVPGTTRRNNEFALLSEAFSTVVNQASVIEVEQQQSLPVLKKTYLQHLLRGTLHDLSATHVIQSTINDYFSSPAYTVIVAKIDRFAEFEQQHNQTKQGLFRFSISNISNELMLEHMKNEPIVIDERTLAFLLFLDTPILPDRILLTLNEIQKVIHSYFHFTVTFSIGDVVCERTDIQQSFESAQHYATYRFFQGHQSIIHAELVNHHQEHIQPYPAAAEKKLLEALRLNHLDQAEQALAGFMKDMDQMSYYYALSCSNQLLNSLMREFDGILPILQEYAKNYYEIVNRLQEQETIQEVQTLLSSFCAFIVRLSEQKQTSKTDMIIDSICTYLQEHYHDPNLGIEAIADSVQLSPGYLGKLFRSRTQMSFNDYLKNIRLEEAKRQLISTRDPVSLISERIGVLNTTYFFTLFKKTYGLSPAQYRDQHSGGND